MQRLQRGDASGRGASSSTFQPPRISHAGMQTERQASALEDRRHDSNMDLTGLSPPDPSVGEIPGSVGHPLPESLRRDLKFPAAADLSQVRVHHDEPAHALTRGIGAKAATWGSHIYFGRNRFDPESEAGQRLLAHELVHTMQPEARSLIHRSPEDNLQLQQIDRQLESRVITDEYRAELERKRAAITARQASSLQAFAREAERRTAAAARNVSEPEEGPSTVTVPLWAMISVPARMEAQTLFSIAGDGIEEGLDAGTQYVADQYLAGKLDWSVTVDLVEPGDGVWFNFSVNGNDVLVSRKLEFPLSALDSISPEPLGAVVKRATKIVEVATLTRACPEVIAQIGTLPEDMIADPQRYARNETIALEDLVSRYIGRLNRLSTSLLPSNEWLNEPLAKCQDALHQLAARIKKADKATEKFHEKSMPGTSMGESYNRLVEESSNIVERVGWEIWKSAGDAVTLGAQSDQAENTAMYRRGEISLNDYWKNYVLIVGKVGFKAVMLALTAGRATGPALRILGLEGGTAAAAVAGGMAEGVTGGFVDAFSSDLYAKTIATFSGSPGVVAFHERSIRGPASWFESAAFGGSVGGIGAALGHIMPKAPLDVSKIQRELPFEPREVSLGEGATAEIKVVSSNSVTGDITLSIKDPATGELFVADGNVHTGTATVTNASTNEVIGYVRGDAFEAAPQGGALSAAEPPALEARTSSLAEADVTSVAQDVAPAPPGGSPAGAVEIRLSDTEYLEALGHAFPQTYLDDALRVIDDIGRATAADLVRDPTFMGRVRQASANPRRWNQVGTAFHEAAKLRGRQLAQAGQLPPGWVLDFERTVQSGKGGSRFDVLARGPGAALEVDWKTTGRSALESVEQMERHARQIADPKNLGLTLTGQRSISWADEVRSAWETLQRVDPAAAQQAFGGPITSINWPSGR